MQMPRFRLLHGGSLLLVLALAACGDVLGSGGPKAPTIVSSDPAAGAQGIPVDAELEIRFSRELDPASIVDAVKLLEDQREILTEVYLKNRKVVILRPTDPLDFGTEYGIRVEGTILSRAGKPMSDLRSWTFSTLGLPPPTLNVDSLRGTLEALAHDSMRGRGSGTQDELRAAQYLQERFLFHGLQSPPGGSLQAFQAFSDRLHITLSSQNVLAIIPGAGSLAQEWVVVGAHYDHIGLRLQEDGSMGLNNGADDNGSGTALILELARLLQDYVEDEGMPVADRRSVLFAAWGAEEVGLLGSCYYVHQAPAAPLLQTVAMLNFDMVGRLRDQVLILRGYESSSSWPLMVRNSNDPELILYDVVSDRASSDFACFMQEGIPWVFFHTGLHEEYHTPADDPELINYPGLADVGQVALRVLIRLMVMEGLAA